MKIASALLSLFLVAKVSGHGMMLEPPNRSSLWRFDPTAPPNYNDNQNYCGGAAVSNSNLCKTSKCIIEFSSFNGVAWEVNVGYVATLTMLLTLKKTKIQENTGKGKSSKRILLEVLSILKFP